PAARVPEGAEPARGASARIRVVRRSTTREARSRAAYGEPQDTELPRRHHGRRAPRVSCRSRNRERPVSTRSPYVGLRPFKTDESDIYAGRETQTDELLRRLDTTRFLAVIGRSGCGKSSLVRAGLIASLETGMMPSAGIRWRVAAMRPGGNPMLRLAQALLDERALGPERGSGDGALGFLTATLSRGPRGLVDALDETPMPPGYNLLL